MKKIVYITMLLIFGLGWAQKGPSDIKTKFTTEALQQKVQDEDGKEINIKNILDRHKGKIVIIDFWASWCRDCILALPKSEELYKNNPDVDFIYLSLDRSKEAFDKSLDRFSMRAKENYWFFEGWKNTFNDYVELNWIPRFMIVDQKSEIAQYYSISPDDPEIQKTIDRLKK